MTMIKDIDAEELIKRTAEELKKMEGMAPPEWSAYVKTGAHKERPPVQEDWWWIRSASMLRKIYMNQSTGVSKLRKEYGGRKNRGHKPEHKCRASGKIIRTILQQLESAGFVRTDKKKGRTMTAKGISFLNSAAKSAKKGG